MEGSTLEKHSCVLNSIVGTNCTIGPWARVDGVPEPEQDTKEISVTVLATEVTLAPETLVRSCIVLPNVSRFSNPLVCFSVVGELGNEKREILCEAKHGKGAGQRGATRIKCLVWTSTLQVDCCHTHQPFLCLCRFLRQFALWGLVALFLPGLDR